MSLMRRAVVLAGVDEAGRGPLAGPVVAAAVILDPRRRILGLADSKLLGAARRVELAREIRRKARAFSLGLADHEEIDRLNILRASLLAMERAIRGLKIAPERILVDGKHVPELAAGDGGYMLEAVVRGDQTVPSISAASILAKVCRDRLMQRAHRRYPDYGFDRHKGYPTRVHLEMLERFGPCLIHRKHFAPVERLGAQVRP